MAKPLPKPGSPNKGLNLLGMEYAEVLGHPDTVPIFRVIMAEAPRFQELGEYLFECGKMPFLHRIHLFFEEEIKLGTLKVDDMPSAASQFLGMFNDAIFWPRFFLMSMTVSDEGVCQVINEAVATMLIEMPPEEDIEGKRALTVVRTYGLVCSGRLRIAYASLALNAQSGQEAKFLANTCR